MEINLKSRPHLLPAPVRAVLLPKSGQGQVFGQVPDLENRAGRPREEDCRCDEGDGLRVVQGQEAPSRRQAVPRDGDQSDREEEAGYWALSASDDRRPVVVDRNRSPVVAEDDLIYAGCFVNAKVRLWVQDNQYGRRINANLMGVQFVKDGDRLGGGRTQQSADDMFDDVADAFGDEGADDNPFG